MSTACRAAFVASVLAACGDNLDAPPQDPAPDYIYLRYPGQPDKPRVLVYTFENYWRHPSALDCLNAIATMATTRGFNVSVTNHPLGINAKNLADVDVVAFCVTSGDGLVAQGRQDLETWIRAGGGTVGFHSAAATETSWQFYVDDVGTTFAGHADGLWPVTLRASPAHPITAGLGDFQLTDEWYFFVQPPESVPGTEVVLALDEDTLSPDYPAALKQGYHAIAWTSERFGGRMFYAGFGHRAETFGDPIALEIIGRAIEWAAHRR